MTVLRGDFGLYGVLRSLTNRTHRLRDRVVEGTHSGAEIDLDMERLLQKSLPILNIYSEGDWSIDYLRIALGSNFASRLSAGQSRFELIDGTNHVFTLVWSQDRVLELVSKWQASVNWPHAASLPN